MGAIAFDSETFPIIPGLLAPPPVCFSFAWRGCADLQDAKNGINRVSLYLGEGTTLVGHNVAYDFAVICAAEKSLIGPVFDAYRNGRVRDTGLRESLLDIAKGKLRPKGYSLDYLSQKYRGKALNKGEDSPRVTYARLASRPLDTWPQDAREYALEDAVATLDVYEAQTLEARKAGLLDGLDVVRDELPQVFAAWALHLTSVWGIRTDATAVDALRESIEASVAVSREHLLKVGLLKYTGPKKDPRRGVSKDMGAIKARVVKALGGKKCEGCGGTGKHEDTKPGFDCGACSGSGYVGELPRTPTGEVSTDGLTLKDSGDADLIALDDANGNEKLLSSFVPVLERGTEVPINARYNPLVESGRTSCRDPNIQQLPKAGGVRECFVARPGTAFVFCDLKTAESRALAEACYTLLGFSDLGEALKAGRDVHLEVAAEVLGLPYEQAERLYNAGDPEVDRARNLAKVPNFGLPAGMSADTLVDFALSSYGMRLDPVKTRALKAAWLARWREMDRYYAYNSRLVGHLDNGTVTQLVSGRVRGGLGYCAACNTWFQGLVADWAKAWLAETCTEAYTRPESALFGARPVAFIHDEIALEVPLARVDGAAKRLRALAIETGGKYLKSVPAETGKPVACLRWLKGAKPTYDASGRLVPTI